MEYVRAHKTEKSLCPLSDLATRIYIHLIKMLQSNCGHDGQVALMIFQILLSNFKCSRRVFQ